MEDYERVESELLEQCGRVATLAECFVWLEQCNECIESLEELCRAKRPCLTVGHRQSAVARIARLEEPQQFLEDAGSVVLERVRGAIERHGSVKVNTASNGEFIAGDKRTVMGINRKTANYIGAPICASVPPKIKDKNALVNVRSMDNTCFAWLVIAALYPAERHAERESSYPYYSKVLNFADIEFLVTLKDVAKFERSNTVSVNVYGIEDGDILSLRLTDCKRDRHVNLLYVQDGDTGHFATIKHLFRFVGTQINKKGHKKYFCERCLHYFSSNEKLERHSEDCQKLNKCAIRLPRVEQRWLEFGNYYMKERAPFVVYADLECVLRKTEDAAGSSSYAYQRHEMCSIAYYVHCSYDGALFEYRCWRGNDCVSWFARQLETLAHRVKNAITTNRPMDFTRDDWRRFDSATHCHICERPFAPGDERARDHCHLTGRYRGPAHKGCNVNYKNSMYIPVVFHNLSGYDAHFVIREIATQFQGQVDLLPLTKEKYISFTKHVTDTSDKDSRKCVKLRFIDSYKFLSASLDKLASYLDKDKLKIVRSEFSHVSDEEFDLLTRKGVFPYEYVDSVEKLNDTRLPLRESFHSSLTGDTVSESDYAHAENV
ncbi:PREDICTED: uncharacterized protein LOC108781172 [Cyphomyrmex costatus]|uniref:uncharacterized protein LOC108781172 n=1 Tax=Cyphomyrmex costatus TaxID=456900 RepID=UPI0008523827|nr:PREDICTED: uncharacterized protein LOC108781172 [Cyphomyrmex costatus]